MTPILLTPFDIAIAASLIVFDAVLSILLKIRLHRQLGIARQEWSCNLSPSVMC
jgi:putative ABC transport system permease protein